MHNRYKSIQTGVFLYFFSLFIFCTLFMGVFLYFFSSNMLERYTYNAYRSNCELKVNTIENRLSNISQFMDYQFTNPDIKLLFSKDMSSYEKIKIEERLDESIRSSQWYSYMNFIKEFKVFSGNEEIYYFSDFDMKNLVANASITSFGIFDDNKYGHETRFFILEEEDKYSIIAFRSVMNSNYTRKIGTMVALIDSDILFKDIISENEGIFLKDNGFFLAGNEDVVQEKNITADFDENSAELIILEIEELNAYFVEKFPEMFENNDFKMLLMVGCLSILSGLLFSNIIWHTMKGRMIKHINSVSRGLEKVREETMEPISDVPVRYSEIYDLVNNYNLMVSQLSDLIGKNVNEALKRQEAEYQALKMQINPHFLYNALNTIRWMAIIHQADNIREFSENLSNLLQHISKSNNIPDYTLREELEIVKEYVFIQQIAYNFKFSFELNIEDETLLDNRCMNFFLQPIVENSILHGLGGKTSQGLLSISIYSETMENKDSIAISIFDDGLGFEIQDEPKKKMTGIGIDNIRKRLVSHYKEKASFSIQSVPGEFTEVIIIIPKDGKHE